MQIYFNFSFDSCRFLIKIYIYIFTPPAISFFFVNLVAHTTL